MQEQRESRNPTVLIREVPRFPLRDEHGRSVRKSQSHRTDQGSSKTGLSDPLTLQALKLAVFVTGLEGHFCFLFSTAFQLASSPVTPEDSTGSTIFVTSLPNWHF